MTTDHNAAKPGLGAFSAGHKTRGGALSCLQPICALERGPRGGDAWAQWAGHHALAFWFTVIFMLLRDARGRPFLRFFLRRDELFWGCS